MKYDIASMMSRNARSPGGDIRTRHVNIRERDHASAKFFL